MVIEEANKFGLAQLHQLRGEFQEANHQTVFSCIIKISLNYH